MCCWLPFKPGWCTAPGNRGHGAIDVSDFARFGVLMERCPFRPRLFNALSPIDPAHFSSTGRRRAAIP
jgi:hypothetical protein